MASHTIGEGKQSECAEAMKILRLRLSSIEVGRRLPTTKYPYNAGKLSISAICCKLSVKNTRAGEQDYAQDDTCDLSPLFLASSYWWSSVIVTDRLRNGSAANQSPVVPILPGARRLAVEVRTI
jgi:hypothetical protein